MDRPVNRRRFVQAATGSLAIGLAGCMDDNEEDETDSEPATTGSNGGDESEGNETDTDPSSDDDSGDDSTGEGSEGLLYAFAPDRAVLIDPEAGEIVTDLDAELSDADWGDARLTHDERKLFAVESGNNRVGVVDTDARAFVDWVDVGPGATHAFHPVDDEIWVHADAEGRFYVIGVDSHEVEHVVQSGFDVSGHGKLIHHDEIYPTAYATNTDDSALHVIDLEAHERPDSIEAVGDEGGTHYAMYAPENGLVYVERSGGDDMPVVDPATDEVVDRLDINGGLSIGPNLERLAVWEGDQVHFIDATDEDSEILGTLDLEGRGPDDVDYFEEDGTLYAIVANTTSSEVSVVNVDDLEIVAHVAAGSISRDGEHLHRSGTLADGNYFTTSGADGTVPIIDVGARELRHEVEVSEGVDTLAYVGDGSGAWY
ncbi:YncE family protein [Halopiger goleimassiliensis]|uniref:YncE family protein n=1 Tax=Halopiger goleimassiliensis TaxID=1293048 RepID=UPI000677EAC7|nr:hypothetical protein [Halopiger goleimassiliensis]